YTWYNAVRQVPFSWQQPNPDTSICRIVRQRSVICHSREHVSTALESSGGWLSCCCSKLLPLCCNTTNS
ncbi:unnamed protein product, partial [Staurois parvus]